jgi:hypothetical protein
LKIWNFLSIRSRSEFLLLARYLGSVGASDAHNFALSPELAIGPDSGGWCNFWPADGPRCYTTAGWWKYITFPGVAYLDVEVPRVNNNV